MCTAPARRKNLRHNYIEILSDDDDEAKSIRGGAAGELAGIVNANYDPLHPPVNAANLSPRSQAYRATLTNYDNPSTKNTPPDNYVASALEEGHNPEATAAEDEEDAGRE